MDCSVDFASFVRGNNLSPLAKGGTSEVYSGSGIVAKHAVKYAEDGVIAREVCILDRLRGFPWSPKLLCAQPTYFVTRLIDDPGKTCLHLPRDYDSQMATIVGDMESVGVRHNDMLKEDSSDVVVSRGGRVHLTDFGWGTLDGSLSARCEVGGVSFVAPNTRPSNPILDRGFANKNETHHRHPCKKRHFTSFRQRGGEGSQVETPRVVVEGERAIVSGYQHFQLSPTSLSFHGEKYAYLRDHLSLLASLCGKSRRLVDVGGNTGLVSFLAERGGFSPVYSLDHDAPAIEVVRRAASAVHSGVEGRVFSFGDPLPQAEVVLCGALIHWVFCLTADFSGDFERILGYLAASATRYLVVEWVDPKDAAIRTFHHVEKCGQGLSRLYTLEGFLSALGRVGKVTHTRTFSTRTLYTVEKTP